MHFTQASFIIRIPIGILDVDKPNLLLVRQSLKEGGLTFDISAEEYTPVSGSWAELVIASIAGGIAGHYIGKILDAFDAIVSRTIEGFILGVRSGNCELYTRVSLRDREAGTKALADALFQLRIAAERSGGVVYWLRDAQIREDGTIAFNTTVFNGENFRSAVREIKTASPDFSFYDWVIRERRPTELITDEDIHKLQQEFASLSK